MNRYRCTAGLVVAAGVAFAPAAFGQARLFCIDGSTSLHELDPTTGAIMNTTPLSGATFTIAGGLAYDPATDTLFMSSTSLDSLFTVDYNTGLVTLIGSFGLGGAEVMHGFEIDDTGQLYGYSTNVAQGARFFRIDRNTGQATGISDPGWGSFGSMGFVPATQTMYIIDAGLDNLYTIDRTTGVATLIGPLNASSTQVGVGMAYDSTYGMLAVNNSLQDTLWSIDLGTGQATFINNLATGNVLSLAFIGPATPTCYPDCDTSTGVGVLDIFDFLCFGNRFSAGDPYACDCDTSTGPLVCDIFDFLCFGNAFNNGCP